MIDFPTTKHPIHPVYQQVCDEHMKQLAAASAVLSATPEEKYTMIQSLRSVADEFSKNVAIPETIRTKQQVVGGPDSRKVDTTIFRPLGTENEILPVILYFHGGGWVFGSATTHAKIATDLCIKSHAAVMLVEYSLSPEVQFPVANEESFAALCWVHHHGQSIHLDTSQIIVAGDSAGGNMAAVVSMMAKDRGVKGVIKAQVLLYPAVGEDKELYESYRMYGGGECYLSLYEAEIFSSAYFPKPTLELNDRYASPTIATIDELKGLPPALVLTCECDILRDEGEVYAAKLMEAEVYTVGIRIMGTIHGYMSTPLPDTPQYRTSIKIVCDFIKEHFKKIK